MRLCEMYFSLPALARSLAHFETQHFGLWQKLWPLCLHFRFSLLAISSNILISFSIQTRNVHTQRYATGNGNGTLFNVYLFICFFSPIYSKRPLQNRVRYSIILDRYKNELLSNALLSLSLYLSISLCVCMCLSHTSVAAG